MRPITLGGLTGDGSAQAALEAEQAAAEEAAAAATVRIAAIGGGIGGFFALLAGLCCFWWFCVARRRRVAREQQARARLARQSKLAKVTRTGTAASVANTLGVAPKLDPKKRIGFAATPTATGMTNILGAMNPALVKTVAPAQGGRRMTMALAAYKNTSAFKPTGIRNPRQALLEEDAREVQTESLTEEVAIGIAEEDEEAEEVQESYDTPHAEDVHEEDVGQPEYSEEQTMDMNESAVEEETAEDAADEDDYVDEDEAVGAAGARKVGGNTASGGGWLSSKQKKTVESAVAPPVENKKLVIGRGAVLQEQVHTQTVKLRRVSKVRGDRDLTASRTRFTRPSVATPYAFTATVARTVVKTDTGPKERTNALYGLNEDLDANSTS
jgi:hypothetical protein